MSRSGLAGWGVVIAGARGIGAGGNGFGTTGLMTGAIGGRTRVRVENSCAGRTPFGRTAESTAKAPMVNVVLKGSMSEFRVNKGRGSRGCDALDRDDQGRERSRL